MKPLSKAHAIEGMRWALLVGLTLWLFSPYFEPRLIGTGDALWYHHLLADAVTQFRAGVFPVFVGQSDFSFNGAIYPLRAAPYYQYLGGLLDLLARHRLGFFALQHLALILSYVAGALCAYGALIRIAPARRWTALALALLYVSCPGVAGLAYAQDLYMSCMTAPWVPLAFGAMICTFDDESLAPQAVLGMSLAALWWAHSPIALWATLVGAVTQIVRVARQGLNRRQIARGAASAAIFCALAAYPILSVFLLRTRGEAIVPYLMDRTLLLREIGADFPGSLLPINLGGPSLTELQLGYGLWAVFAASVVGWWFRARPASAGILLASATFLLVLVFPVPGITRALWFGFPETLVGMTLYWPMQRLYILIAAATAVCAQRLLRDAPSAKGSVASALSCGLFLAVGWSLFEASLFIRKADAQPGTVEDSRRWSLTENVAIQRHSYGLFEGRPAYFSHGVMDPRMENRLLDPATGAIVASNYDVGFGRGSTGMFRCATDANPGIIDLKPEFALEPGERYLLTFAFARPDTTGLLQIIGPSFYREYLLPRSGEAKAFGSAADATKSITLWTSLQKPETVALRFIPAGDGRKTANGFPFAGYSFEKIDDRRLPVRVESLIPYRAMVHSPMGAILETPRMFVPGYIATVDGRRVPVRKSAEGLVGFAVPAGRSQVQLRYAGPPALSVAFWLSISGWAFLGFWMMGRPFSARHRGRQQKSSSP